MYYFRKKKYFLPCFFPAKLNYPFRYYFSLLGKNSYFEKKLYFSNIGDHEFYFYSTHQASQSPDY